MGDHSDHSPVQEVECIHSKAVMVVYDSVVLCSHPFSAMGVLSEQVCYNCNFLFVSRILHFVNS
ncbi:hypothetical protein E2C01_042930 [Portunus trituberculatus]|uniref:Uncharacterized protein n=1 Tax=Portunus trituberculatus TaxID=210409 RepID=A0A5B7FUB4_PORTR|nr:hypothetical protein [Portunus trituberculatus]